MAFDYTFTGTPNENSYIVYNSSAISLTIQQIDQTFTTDDIGIRLLNTSGGALAGFYIPHSHPQGSPSPDWGYTELKGKITPTPDSPVSSIPPEIYYAIVGDYASPGMTFDKFEMTGTSLLSLKTGEVQNETLVHLAVSPSSVFVDRVQRDIFLPDLSEGQYLFISLSSSFEIYIPRISQDAFWGIYLTAVDKTDISGYKTRKVPLLIVRKIDYDAIPVGSPFNYPQSHIEYDYINQVSFWWNSKSIIRIGLIEQTYDSSSGTYNYSIDYSNRDENNLLNDLSFNILNLTILLLNEVRRYKV